MSTVGRVFVSMLLLLVACGDGTEVIAPDAGGDAEADASASTPAPPGAPTWTCPAGWTEDDGACAPWGVNGPDCPDGRFRFPGDAACAPLAECPVGDFAEGIEAAGRILHVRSGIAPGGDGSASAPLATIADAMSRAAPGDVVSLAKGTYDATVRLRGGVSLIGACAAETTIGTTRTHDFEGVVTVDGSDATLRGVTLTGARAGLWVDTHSVRVEDVVVDRATGFGAVASFGGRITGSGLAITWTQLRDGRYGVGVIAADGGSVELERLWLANNLEVGASTNDAGSSLTLSRSVVSGTGPNAAGRYGRGAIAQGGAVLTLRETVVQHNAESAVIATSASEALLEDVVVYGAASDTERRGISVLQGSALTARRLLVEGTHEYAIAAAQPETAIVLEDAFVRRTGPAADGTSGHALLVDEGATGRVERAVFEESRDTAVLVRGVGTSVGLSDVRIARTESALWNDSRGVGIEANGGAGVTVTRAALESNHQAGVIAFDEGTHLVLEDIRISDTLERACATSDCAGSGAGVGAVAVRGAELSLTRFVIERSALAGAQMVSALLSMAEGEIRDNPVGVNLQDTDRTLDDVATDVRFVDNERNFDAAMLWVPDPR